MSRVYLSASWKQRDRVRALAVSLRSAGHEVYDFTDPACRRSEEIPPERFPRQFDPAEVTYREYIQGNPYWREAVEGNRAALRWCDAVVLLLPAGADSHSDWALGVGLGKLSCVVGHPPAGERTPSHLWADALLDGDGEVAGWLALGSPAPAPSFVSYSCRTGFHGACNHGGPDAGAPCGCQCHSGGAP